MTAPHQRGEVVIRLPVLDPTLAVTPADRLIEAEVMALMRHLRHRSRISRPAPADTMLIAMIETTARTMAGLALALGVKDATLQGFHALANHMTQRAAAMIEGVPFGPAPEAGPALGSSAEVASLLEAMPPLHEESDFGVLAHKVAGAMAEKGIEVFEMETLSLTPQQKNAALVMAAAESAVVVALCCSSEEHIGVTMEFIQQRMTARAEQAIAARKAKMG